MRVWGVGGGGHVGGGEQGWVGLDRAGPFRGGVCGHAPTHHHPRAQLSGVARERNEVNVSAWRARVRVQYNPKQFVCATSRAPRRTPSARLARSHPSWSHAGAQLSPVAHVGLRIT